MTTALMIADHIVSIYHTMCNVQYGNVVNEETSAAVAVVSTTGVTCDAIWRTIAAVSFFSITRTPHDSHGSWSWRAL